MTNPANPAARDVSLLFVARMLRMAGFGMFSLILKKHLLDVGFSESAVGWLLALAFAGDTAISLWLTTTADRHGRRATLVAGAGLMIVAGGLFGLSGNYWLLLVAAIVGVVSPNAAEVGPFLAVEQAAVSEVVEPTRRTTLFARYNFAGYLAAAAGQILTGEALTRLARAGVDTVLAQRYVFAGYAVIGAAMMILFWRVSPSIERVERSAAPDDAKAEPRWLGLGPSRGVVLGLSALFAVDAFGGGFLLDTIVAQWLRDRFHADERSVAWLLAGAKTLAGVSSLVAGGLAQRIGLLATMVVTHLPSNLLVVAMAFAPNFPWAVAIWLLRSSVSQMDVPTRQAFTMAVVQPEERAAAAGVTGVARSIALSAAPPVAAGLLSAFGAGSLFVAGGVLKIVYDVALWIAFARDKGHK